MIELEKNYLSLMMEAGYVYMGMQKYKEARKVFEGLAALKKESEIPLVALAGVSFCEGKLKEAIKVYQKALKLVPESLYAKAYLAEALFFDGQKPEALSFLKEVDEQDPKGAIGDFARALHLAIQKGFTPETLSQSKEIEEYYAKKQKS